MDRQSIKRDKKTAAPISPVATTAAPSSDSIKVLCRFRPPKQIEIQNYGQSNRIESFALNEDRGTVETITEIDRRAYTFDKLFGMDTVQEQIFVEIESIVESIMSGFNGTILAYGQTSSGKTHTMEGPSLWDTQAQGVIPRTVDKLFSLITEADESTSFTVAVSYYEVYNEKIRDLLNPQQDDLKMREYPNKTDGWFIQDITEVFCTDRESVIRLIETGKTYRATAATLMNADSSRSHSILSILISQKNEKTGRNKKGRLFLVDLAGSEKISKTGATGQTKKEAIGINVSLTTLGMVINALCDGASHIPYRDSKLTLILKNSLGGNSKTTLIICCAPESRHTMETISTLRFGERAKKIKNNAKINEELGIPELKRLLQLAQSEIAQLKSVVANNTSSSGLLQQSTSGISVSASMDGNEATFSEIFPEKDIEDEDISEIAAARSQIESMQSRISELEDELELERNRVASMLEEKSAVGAEINAYKSTISELEQRVLEAKMNSKVIVAENEVPPEDAENKFDSELNAVDEISKDSGGLSLDTLRQESVQLKQLLEKEINNLEDSLIDREQEARSATKLAAEYAEKYARLKEEFDAQIQRLVLKLSLEQQARADVEDRIESVSQQLWTAQSQTTDGSGSAGKNKAGFFGKLFGADTVQEGGNRLSLLIPSISSLSMSKERELQKKVEHLQIRLSHVMQELESTKEAQRIVLDTKESVMRSLLKQNSQVTQERDVLSKRIEDLTATVEQLTGLLRSIQARKQQKTGDSGLTASGSTTSSTPISIGGGAAGAIKRFSSIEQFSISGGRNGSVGDK